MKTLKPRRRDKHADQLGCLSYWVNCVWNNVDDLSDKHLQRTNKFFQDSIHKFTSQLVKNNALIVVGDIKTKRFNHRKSKLAKSVYDTAWFELKRQLEYQCEHAGCRFEKVKESYTTQTCSCCGDSASSPKASAAWRIRE